VFARPVAPSSGLGLSEEEGGNMSDVEANRMKTESVKASKDLIKDHLVEHLVQNPNATYQSWVAVLHPENAHVELDQRMWNEGNAWLTVWKEVAASGSSCCPRRFRSNTSEEASSTNGGLIDITVGALLMCVVAIATILLDGVGCGLLQLAWVCGAMARRMPRAFEPLPHSAPTQGMLAAPLLLQSFLQLLFLGAAGLFQLLSVFLALILAFLQLVFMVVAGACMLIAVIFRELVALIGLVICGLLSLSPSQGWRTSQQIRKVAHETHTAMCNAFCRFVVASERMLPPVGNGMKAYAQAAGHKLRSALSRSDGSVPPDDLEAGAPIDDGVGDSPHESVRKIAGQLSVAMRSFHGTSSSSVEASEAGPVDLLATSRVSENLAEMVENVEEHNETTPTIYLPDQVSTATKAPSLESVSYSLEASETSPEAAVRSEAQRGSAEDAQEETSAQLNVTMLLGRVRALSSAATTVLNSVGAYAETLYPKVAVEQERAHSISGSARPFLMTEAEFYGSSSSGAAPLQPGVSLLTDEMLSASDVTVEGQVGFAQAIACPDLQGELSVSESSESVFHSALGDIESVPRSSEEHDEEFATEPPAVVSDSSSVSGQPAVIVNGSPSATPASAETTDTNMQDTERAGSSAGGVQQKKQAKRPIRRGGQWKKSQKRTHQDVLDIPNTDDGWSD